MRGKLAAAESWCYNSGMNPSCCPSAPATDRRNTERYLVNWRADIEVPGGPVYPGVTCDLSLGGVAVLLDKNLQDTSLLRVRLIIPPVDGALPRSEALILAERRYTILDSRHKQFRIGLSFREYHAGLRALAARLEHSVVSARHWATEEPEAG